MRNAVLILAALFLFCACAPAMNRDQVAKALADNPQLVFDALKRDKAQLLDVIDQAVQERDANERKADLAKGLANPLKPELDPARPYLGAANAPVTIVEYSDFLCGYCAQASQALQEVMAKNPGRIRLLFKHYPAHQGSLEPAAVFEALGMQSKDAAWKFAELAFANQQSLADGSGKGVAAVLAEVKAGAKLDAAKLEKDMKSPAVRARIEADVAEAARFGVEGTPSFVVNGVMVRGALSAAEFEDMLSVVAPKK